MLTFICIVSLIIVIIAIYHYRKLVVVEDTVEGFNSGGYNWYGIPRNWKKDVLYIVVIADDYLDLYHNHNDAPTHGKSIWKEYKWVGRARCCGRAYRFEIKNFQQGHKLMFFNYNGGGPGYFAGHLFRNGKYFALNKSTVKPQSYGTMYSGKGHDYYIRTGKYEGCYRDQGNRRLPYYGYSARSFEACQELALRRNHKYFGTQYGGECWTGNDWRRATSAGKVPDRYCSNKYARGGRYVRWTQRYGLGGPWTNAIYNTTEPFTIAYYGNWSWRWFRNANRGGGWSRLIGYCPGIKPNFAGGTTSMHSLWRWCLYSFELPREPGVVKFCPDKRYTEFNAGGCRVPTNKYSCMNSVLPNHKADMSQCRNKFDVSENNYDNADFYKIVEQALQISLKHGWTGRHKWFKYAFLHVINMACSMIENKDSYFDKKACKAKGWTFDMGYLNEMIDEAKQISDNHAMKNGKNSNKFLRHKLDQAINQLLNKARDLIGIHERECKCKDFKKINVYRNRGGQYCTQYQSYIRHRGNQYRLTTPGSVAKCRAKCNSLQGCDAFAVGEHCVTYNGCKMNGRTQNWPWYRYTGSGKNRKRETHGWYFWTKNLGKPDGQEVVRSPKCKPC